LLLQAADDDIAVPAIAADANAKAVAAPAAAPAITLMFLLLQL